MDWNQILLKKQKKTHTKYENILTTEHAESGNFSNNFVKRDVDRNLKFTTKEDLVF